MSALTDRLDQLAMALHQDGRELDVELVREAIRALTPAVGTPWMTPRKGDVCMRPDGKNRRVVAVIYRHPFDWRRVSEEPGSGLYPATVNYLDESDRPHRCAGSTWANWCRSAGQAGATYVRAPEATA